MRQFYSIVVVGTLSLMPLIQIPLIVKIAYLQVPWPIKVCFEDALEKMTRPGIFKRPWDVVVIDN